MLKTDFFRLKEFEPTKSIWSEHVIKTGLDDNDLGFNDITFYGGGVYGGKVSTPSIDSIGKDGVSFKHAYSGHATCAPCK